MTDIPATSPLPVPLSYPAGGVRCERDGDQLRVLVPADRNARRANQAAFGISMVGLFAVGVGRAWVAVVGALITHAPWTTVARTCGAAAAATFSALGVWFVAAWIFGRWTRPIVIAAGPEGVRYHSAAAKKSVLLPRGRITGVTCGRPFSRKVAVFIVTGQFGRFKWPAGRRVAAGARIDLELVAVELRAVLGLPPVAGGPPTTSAALLEPR